MTRLDTQRQPTRLHARKNARLYARGYDASTHEVWGDSLSGGQAPTQPASTAYAGIPGDWGPPGCIVPANQAAVIGSTIMPVPATAWTTGQYVQTVVAGAGGRVCWTGAAWVGGVAP